MPLWAENWAVGSPEKSRFGQIRLDFWVFRAELGACVQVCPGMSRRVRVVMAGFVGGGRDVEHRRSYMGIWSLSGLELLGCCGGDRGRTPLCPCGASPPAVRGERGLGVCGDLCESRRSPSLPCSATAISPCERRRCRARREIPQDGDRLRGERGCDEHGCGNDGRGGGRFGAEGQSRTADTTVFSRVLYHLSYLGGWGQCT